MEQSQRKVAFVTGASRGIGYCTALAFARAGFDVAIAARTVRDGDRHAHSLTDKAGRALPGSLERTADDIRALGGRVCMVAMDLLDPDSVTAAAKTVLERMGRVDVLVNNAIYQGGDLNLPLLELQPETLQRVAQAYMASPLALVQAVLPAMRERGSGVVINVTSGAGEGDPPVPAAQGGWGYAYGAGKAAVSRLSGVINAEHGGDGILAYTVNPGVVSTDALAATIGDQGVKALGGHCAPPEVPAAVMLWLATSPEAVACRNRTVNAQRLVREQQLVADWRHA